MNYLSVENISKSYGERILFEDISFGINKDQKVAFVAKNEKLASKIRHYLQGKGIPATFHYVPLHSSVFGKKFRHGNMKTTNNVWKRVIRLPLYPELKQLEQAKILKHLRIILNRV